LKINPETYNRLYRRFQNLNKLLSFAHACVIDALYIETAIEKAITDKFMKGSYIDCYLKARVELLEEVGAERYPGVAAASVIARYIYLEELKKLSKLAGVELKSGSGEDAKRIFKELRTKFDRELLSKLAKLHFKI
jgi:ribonuclease HIII